MPAEPFLGPISVQMVQHSRLCLRLRHSSPTLHRCSPLLRPHRYNLL